MKNLTMPDGTVVAGVPDDVDPQKVVNLYVAHLRGQRDAVLAPDVNSIEAAGYAAKGALDRTASGVRDVMETPPQVGHIGPLPVVSPEAVLAHRMFNTLGEALDAIGGKLGLPTPDQARENTQVAKAVAADHPIANFAGNVAFQAPFGGPLGQTALAFSQEGSPVERTVRAATTFGFAKAGEKIGEKIAGLLSDAGVPKPHPQIAGGSADKGMDVAREQTLEQMERAGLVVPPSQANPTAPGMANRVLEGVSGKIQTQQQASILNQPVVNNLIKQDLGVDPSAPLTIGAMKTLRQNAGKAYDAVSKVGPISVDDQFQQDLGQAVAPYLLLKGSFPSSVGNNAIEGLTKDLAGKPELDSGAAVNLLRYLRAHGFANVNSANPAEKDAGIVELKVSQALEDLLDRNLSASGKPALLTAFRAARQLIAKTYSAQDALEEGTGKIVASKLAQQLGRNEPLSGNMALVAKAAQAFPKAFQNVNSSMPGLSPWDAGMSVILGGFGGPQAAMLPLLRPFVRNLLLSPQYQASMVMPRAGASAAGQFGLSGLLSGVSPIARELAPPLGGLLGASIPQSTR